MSKKNEVVVVEDLSAMYPVLSGDSEVVEILAENLSGDSFSPFELDQLKVPSGGMVSWEVETLDGGFEAVKTIEGIVIFTQMQRAFYEVELDDDEVSSGNPPDCVSQDCVVGKGKPGGECAACEYAEYGSAIKGDGQRCKQSRIMYVVRPGQFLPAALKVPASSLKAAKKYLLKLAGAGLPYTSVVTSFGLEKLKSNSGIAYSGITFSVDQKLDPQYKGVVKAMAESFKAAIN